jgi:anti-anti-sigma factor
MKFTIENDNKIVVFTIKERIVGAEFAPELKTKILIEAQPDIKAMIFELSNVESMDSSGLGALLLANRQLRDFAVPVFIVNANNFILNLMKMTKLDQIFEFSENVEQAKSEILSNMDEN